VAITIDWATKVVNVPKADLTLIGPGELYEYDMDTFRKALKDLEDDEEGIVFLDTHVHNPPVTISGILLARQVIMINGYTVTFENGVYAVNLINANSNVADVATVNSVSIRPQNSAGLIDVRNINIAVAGIVGKAIVALDDLSMSIYDEDGVTILRTLNISADGRQRTIA
jgi:hypothetical protein